MNEKSKKNNYDYIVAYRESKDPDNLLKFYKSDTYGNIYFKEPKRKWIRKYDIIASIIKPNPSISILDVGCANRVLAESKLAGIKKYCGFDINEKFNPDYIGDVHHLTEIVKENFDWILLCDVLEHVHDPLKVIIQASAIGKKILIMTPQWYHLECINALDRFRNPRDRHIHFGGAKMWRKLIEAANLRILLERGFYFIPSFAFNNENKFLRKQEDRFSNNFLFQILDEYILDKLSYFPLFKRMGQETIFVAEKKE